MLLPAIRHPKCAQAFFSWSRCLSYQINSNKNNFENLYKPCLVNPKLGLLNKQNSRKHSNIFNVLPSNSLLKRHFSDKQDKDSPKENILKFSPFDKGIRNDVVRQEIKEKGNVLSMPNLLFVSRILAAPYLAYLILEGNYSYAAALCVCAVLHLVARWRGGTGGGWR